MIRTEGAVVEGEAGVALVFDSHDGVEIELRLTIQQVWAMLSEAERVAAHLRDAQQGAEE